MKRVGIFMERFFGFLKSYFYSVFACLYVFSIGWVFGKNRNFIHKVARDLGLPAKIKPAIPEVKLSVLTGAAASGSINIVGYDTLCSGETSLEELISIDSLVKHCDPREIFEIGTFRGKTAVNMAANASASAKVYTLDLPYDDKQAALTKISFDDREFVEKRSVDDSVLRSEYARKITFLYGDSASFDFTPFAGKIDLVFVDGSHTYDYVLNDSQKALQLLRDGKGVIVWHDYAGREGVTKALNELYFCDSRFKELKHIKNTSLACLMLS